MNTSTSKAPELSSFDRKVKAAFQRLEILRQRSSELPTSQRALQTEALQELTVALEELQVAGAELHQQNEELIITRQALETERQRYQELFTFAPDGYLVTDAEGMIQEINRAAAILLNQDQDRLRGKPLFLFIAKVDRQNFLMTLTRLRQGDLSRLEEWELQIQPQAKASVPVAVTVAIVRNPEGHLTGFRWLLRDITERQQAQEALAAERDLLHTLMDNSPDHIYFKDADSRFTRINQAQARFLGLADPAEARGKTDFDFLQADRAQEFYADEQEIVKTGQPLLDKLEAVTDAQEELRWISASKVPVFDQQGQVTGLVGISRDMTGRRQLEEAYHMLVERSLQGLAIFQDNRIVFANPTLAEIMGYKIEELLSLTPDELSKTVHPEDREFVKVRMRDRLAGQPVPPRSEVRFFCKNEQVRWVETYASRIQYQGKPAIQVAYFDITERKQVEEALEESQRFVQRIADAAPYLIYIYDLVEQCNVFMNDQVSNVLGYTLEEFQETGSFDESLIHPNDYGAVANHLEKLATDVSGGILEIEYRMKHASGDWRWLRSREVVFARTTAGLPRQILGTAWDITERKRMEDEKDQLLEAVSQHRERLRALTGQLAEAQEVERKELARELHDQVGQNLTGLNLNLTFVRGQIPDPWPEAESIRGRLDDSLSLLTEVGKRIEKVMVDLHPPVLDDYGLVSALRWYGRRIAAWTDFDIRVEGQEPEPRLATPVEHVLFRIAQEALTNAAKHAQASQVTITVEVEAETVCLTIADNGNGFDPPSPVEIADRRGWGLLTMTERAEAVGGRCRIESQAGQGTTVSVEVPR